MKRALLLCALLSGCASYEKDLRTICDAPNAVNLSAVDPAQKATLLAEHIAKKIKSREAKNLFSGLASVDPATKDEILRSEAAKAGIEKCALVEVWSERLMETSGSYTNDLQSICSATDFSAIQSIVAVTDTGKNLVRTLGNIGIGESARVEMLAREAKAHRVMPCDVVSK